MSSSSGILLVGGSGFIGRALAASLAEEGWEVHVLSRKPAPSLPAGVQGYVGDQGDKAVLRPLLARCTQVVHLASATTPGDTVWHPSAEAEASLLPALHFLECLQDFPESRVIFVSTGGAIYGNSEGANETKIPAPDSFHGASKLALESFFGVLGRRHPGCLTILRPSNVYGPGQGLRHGFGVIRTLLERSRDGGTVTVYGDGSAVRDYLYIDDLVAACRCALSGPAGIYNIGAGVGTSLITLLEVVEKVTGRRLKIDHKPARASDAAQIFLNIRHARNSLAWTPTIGLEEGIRRTWVLLR